MITVINLALLPFHLAKAVIDGVTLGWRYTRPIQISSAAGEAIPPWSLG